MIMTTPNEFLQFANEMGLGREKPTESSPSPLMSHNHDHNHNGNHVCTTTGLSVLNNLCRLIEQIHELRSENNRLRAHIELVDHVQQFQQRILFKHDLNYKKDKDESVVSSIYIHDEEKSDTLSPTNSLKVKASPIHRERKGTHFVHPLYEALSISQIDHDQNDGIDISASTAAHNRNNWSKVRHAFKFTLRKKQSLSPSSPQVNDERKIPTISISIESDDDHLNDNKFASTKKKKQLVTTTSNDNRQMITAEDTDQEDELSHMVRVYHKGKMDGNEVLSSQIPERHEVSSSNTQLVTGNVDDEALLTRKPSKIARYRRKLRSKLDTVKKQFSDPNSSSVRLFHHSHGSIFDDIGSGLNRALITAQIAPAFTKSYQQKMREWETMQKSQFLVNYRRSSISPKIDISTNSRKASLIITDDKKASEPPNESSAVTDYPSVVDELNLEIHNNITAVGPILSPNQRSLIVHQWREIMLEEISLRNYNEYLQKKMILLKELETNLKTLKTNIFCTNSLLKQQSTVNIQHQQTYLPERCRSLQSLIAIPASWTVAVQSAAYSDVLDGTSRHATERAIFYNRQFFDQLEEFKRDREKFEQDSVKELQSLTNLLATQQMTSKQTSWNKTRARLILTRGCLRRLSFMSYDEYPQYFLPDPVFPLQTSIQEPEPTSNVESLGMRVSNDSDLPNELASTECNKSAKRSRFHLKQSFQRSKTQCINQLNIWFQRRRHQSTSATRRLSSTEPPIHHAPSTLSKLLTSPRLARLHQRLSRHRAPVEQQLHYATIPIHYMDDSDSQSTYDLPIHIYMPSTTSPLSHKSCTSEPDSFPATDVNENTNNEPILNPTVPTVESIYLTSAKATRAKERRATFASLSNIFTNHCL